MKVVFLGTGTGIPDPRVVRGYAGVYVRAGREHVLLDAGAGILKQLMRVGVSFLDLDRLFLTHFHPDHCLDLVSILFAMRIPWVGSPSAADTSSPARSGPARSVESPATPDTSSPARSGPARSPARTKPFTVYGPPGLTTLYRRLNTAFQRWLEPRTYRLALREIGPATLRLPGYTLRARRMAHADGKALGYRLESGGCSVAYSGDTDVCDQIVALGRRADLLILECSMPDERKVAGHLTPGECGRIAQAAQARCLALTHFYPVIEPAVACRSVRRAYAGPLILARDLQLWDNRQARRTL